MGVISGSFFPNSQNYRNKMSTHQVLGELLCARGDVLAPFGAHQAVDVAHIRTGAQHLLQQGHSHEARGARDEQVSAAVEVRHCARHGWLWLCNTRHEINYSVRELVRGHRSVSRFRMEWRGVFFDTTQSTILMDKTNRFGMCS